jgi:D-glycero-alpha-D-manno-heptose 1-phosphate guanylyltransferase
MTEQTNETVKNDTISEMIVLAGGLGTRVQSIAGGGPKVLLPVAGRPFLSYVIDYFRMQGVSRFIFSLYYQADAVEQYLKEEYPTLDYSISIEDQPLGTGGAHSPCFAKNQRQPRADH